jgi:hypothetical protein
MNRWLLSAAAAGLSAAFALPFVACSGSDGSPPPPSATAATGVEADPTVTVGPWPTIAGTFTPSSVISRRGLPATPDPAVPTRVPDGSGGVRGPFRGERLIIVAAGVDAPMTSAVVGADGRMPDPPSSDVVVWYDFSLWPGLGGTPGIGGNVVLAGDAYKGGAPPGVFARLQLAQPGHFVRMRMSDRITICYSIERREVVDAADFTDISSTTGNETITLITGGASPSSRSVTTGTRADCADEPATSPPPPLFDNSTPAPLPGHHSLGIVAENSRFTIVQGGTVPPGFHTVDVILEHRDAGIAHSLAIYGPNGDTLVESDPLIGPTNLASNFAVDRPGTYTFRCTVHPATMNGIVIVE